MMFDIVVTKGFKKDYYKVERQGIDLDIVNNVIFMIANDEILPPRYMNHRLVGRLAGFEECHIRPDLLLVYHKDRKTHELFLSRLGSHSEIFY